METSSRNSYSNHHSRARSREYSPLSNDVETLANSMIVDLPTLLPPYPENAVITFIKQHHISLSKEKKPKKRERSSSITDKSSPVSPPTKRRRVSQSPSQRSHSPVQNHLQSAAKQPSDLDSRSKKLPTTTRTSSAAIKSENSKAHVKRETKNDVASTSDTVVVRERRNSTSHTPTAKHEPKSSTTSSSRVASDAGKAKIVNKDYQPLIPSIEASKWTAEQFEEAGGKVKDKGTRLKRQADNLQKTNMQEKADLYLQAGTMFLEFAIATENALELYKKSNNTLKVKKLENIVTEHYRSTANFLRSCIRLVETTNRVGLFYACLAVSHQKAFSTFVSTMAKDVSITKTFCIKENERPSAAHELFMKAMVDLMDANDAWEKSLNLNCVFPFCCSSPSTLHDLIKHVKTVLAP